MQEFKILKRFNNKNGKYGSGLRISYTKRSDSGYKNLFNLSIWTSRHELFIAKHNEIILPKIYFRSLEKL